MLDFAAPWSFWPVESKDTPQVMLDFAAPWSPWTGWAGFESPRRSLGSPDKRR